jgi:hypothetical protein
LLADKASTNSLLYEIAGSQFRACAETFDVTEDDVRCDNALKAGNALYKAASLIDGPARSRFIIVRSYSDAFEAYGVATASCLAERLDRANLGRDAAEGGMRRNGVREWTEGS